MYSIILQEEVPFLLNGRFFQGSHWEMSSFIKRLQLWPLFFPPGEEGAAEEGKDGKSAKAKRSHFGRAVSLKNFIMRKGKSTSVDMGEGAKEEEEAAEGAEAAEEAEEAGADGEAATATEETNDKDAATGEKTEAAETGGEVAKEAEKEVEKTPADAPVTNGENNGHTNGTAEEHDTHNHQEEEKTTGGSPVKKTKEAGAKDEANAKIINATAAVNSGELERAERDSDEPQNSSSSSKEGDTNNRQQQQAPALTNDSSKQTKTSCQHPQIVIVVSGVEEEDEGEEGGEAQSPQNGGGLDAAESCDQGEREEEEEEEEEMRKRDLRDAAVAIVQNVMSAATDQLERELCVDNGLNGCYDGDI